MFPNYLDGAIILTIAHLAEDSENEFELHHAKYCGVYHRVLSPKDRGFYRNSYLFF